MKLRGRVSQSRACCANSAQARAGCGGVGVVGVVGFVGVRGFECIFGRPEPYVEGRSRIYVHVSGK